MVYGVILKKGEKFYTYLGKIFNALENEQNKYNWLITDSICYPQTPDYNEMFNKAYCWLSGKELTSIIKNEDFQWIWAVLSGFDKDISLSEVLEYPLSYAEGYEGYWKNPISIQHPLASIEIVPCDSSMTLVISRQKEIIDRFKSAFPLSEDLF